MVRKSCGIDWYKIPIEQVFDKLGCTKNGLTNEDVKERLGLFGPNKFDHLKESVFLKLLLETLSPRLVATIIAVADGWATHSLSVMMVFGVVILLLSPIVTSQEHNFHDMYLRIARLSKKVKVLRDGRWHEDYPSALVPGDVIIITAGDIIPADARLLYGGHLTIDEQPLNINSLKVTKGTGDAVYAGSICEHGESKAVIVATGVRTYYRKTTRLDSTTSKVTQLQKVMASIRNVFICFVALGMLVEIFIMYPFQHRAFHSGINNLLVLLIGGIPTGMHAFVTAAVLIGSSSLDEKGAILKRLTVVKDMADIDVLCSDTSGTLTLNEHTINKNLIKVFAEGVDANTVVLLAARACKTENLDAIDAAIVGMLDDPKEAWIGIQEVSSQSCDPTDEQTPITYVDIDGKLKRVCKGTPQQILNLAHNKKDIEGRVHALTEKFSERGWNSLAVAYQEVTDRMKNGSDSSWDFVGIIPFFTTPRHDSADAVARMWDLCISIKMITGDQLKVAKEIGRCLGMGTNIYFVSSILGKSKEYDLDSASSMKDLIENADGFADVGPGHKYEIIKCLQDRRHICAICTGHEATDCSALKKADVGIAMANATDAARAAADIILSEPGLNLIISVVLTCQKISFRIKEYFIYMVSTSVHIVVGFMLLALVWKIDFPPLLVLMIVMINEGLSASYVRHRVKRPPTPDRWGLLAILKTGVVTGGYLVAVTVIFVWSTLETDFFQRVFGVASLTATTVDSDYKMLKCAIFLQVSLSGPVLVIVTQSRKWSLPKAQIGSRLSADIMFAVIFASAHMLPIWIAVFPKRFPNPTIEGIGWSWVGVIWLYNIIFYIPLMLAMKVFSYYGKQKIARNDHQRSGTSHYNSLVANLGLKSEFN